MQTEQLLCWCGMTDTEHKTPGSNKEKLHTHILLNRPMLVSEKVFTIFIFTKVVIVKELSNAVVPNQFLITKCRDCTLH